MKPSISIQVASTNYRRPELPLNECRSYLNLQVPNLTTSYAIAHQRVQPEPALSSAFIELFMNEPRAGSERPSISPVHQLITGQPVVQLVVFVTFSLTTCQRGWLLTLMRGFASSSIQNNKLGGRFIHPTCSQVWSIIKRFLSLGSTHHHHDAAE